MKTNSFSLIFILFWAFAVKASEKSTTDPSIPPVVNPGTYGNPDKIGKPPSDALVLFNGQNFDKWESTKGGEVKWKLVEGAMEVVCGTGVNTSLLSHHLS